MSQYVSLCTSDLDTVPLGVTFCGISLPLLCHLWVCSLLIFECAKTFTTSNRTLDYVMIALVSLEKF